MNYRDVARALKIADLWSAIELGRTEFSRADALRMFDAIMGLMSASVAATEATYLAQGASPIMARRIAIKLTESTIELAGLVIEEFHNRKVNHYGEKQEAKTGEGERAGETIDRDLGWG